MINKLITVLLACILFLEPACSVNALEGIVKFKNTFIKLEIAVTDEEKSKGLMNRTSLPKDRGMVFVFRPKQNVTFWMKDTFIPLDIIFIDKGRIVNIAKNTKIDQTEELYPSDSPITEVVEVNAGFTDEHNIKAGDIVTFENISSIDYSTNSKLRIIKK